MRDTSRPRFTGYSDINLQLLEKRPGVGALINKDSWLRAFDITDVPITITFRNPRALDMYAYSPLIDKQHVWG